jgi:hypothetical protein
LFDVDVIFDGGIQEGFVNIQMEEVKVQRGGKGEDAAENGRENDWRESLFEVNALALTAALGNEPDLESGILPEVVCLNLVNPLDFDDPEAGGKANKGPCVIRLEGVGHQLHGNAPLRGVGTSSCLGERGRFGAFLCRQEGKLGG